MPTVRWGLVLGVSIGCLLLVGWVFLPTPLLSALETVLFTPWFPVILIGIYVVRPFFAWPIIAISILVGYRYGLILGLPIALLGAIGTSLIPYYVGRVSRPQSGIVGSFTTGSERFFTTVGGLRGVIAARLAPTPAEPVSVAAGFGRVPVPAFVLGTAIGELPWTIAALFVGRSLQELTTSGLSLSNPWLVLGGAGAAFVLIASPLYRYITQVAHHPDVEHA